MKSIPVFGRVSFATYSASSKARIDSYWNGNIKMRFHLTYCLVEIRFGTCTEAHAEIDGGPEKYVKSGSTLKLTCHLRQSSVTPDFVFWYQDERMINYEGANGVKVISDAVSSTLIIEKAQSIHSGNYSCVPYNVNPSSVIVHILNGKPFYLIVSARSSNCYRRQHGDFR